MCHMIDVKDTNTKQTILIKLSKAKRIENEGHSQKEVDIPIARKLTTLPGKGSMAHETSKLDQEKITSEQQSTTITNDEHMWK